VRSLATAANNTAIVARDPDGTEVMRSEHTHLVSVLSRGGRFSNDTFALPSLYVIVTNGGKENITLEPSDISAYAGDRRVALLNPVALQDRLDREQAAAGTRSRFPIGMRDASQPGEEPHGYHRRHPIPNSSSTGPAVEPYGPPDFKVPTRIVEQALQPQIIRPGDVGGGRIMLEAENILSGLPLKLVVTVAGEKHEFLFDVEY
jgi:hypothetical protein